MWRPKGLHQAEETASAKALRQSMLRLMRNSKKPAEQEQSK